MDDHDIRVQDGPEETEEEALIYDEMATNLCEALNASEPGKRCLKKISEQVLKDFESAWDGAEEYRERRKKDWKIFSGQLPPKDFPWKDAANASVPIMIENLSRLQMRMSSELFGNWDNVVGALPLHAENERSAQIVTKHMNWQTRNEIPDFRRQIGSRGVLFFIADGDVVADSFYDPAKGRNRHEILSCDEFFCPFTFVTTEPDMSDVPYAGKILHRYRHELQRMRGEWFDVDAVLERSKPSWDDEPEQTSREAMAEIHGIEADNDNGKAPYKLIEYRGWAELPNQDNDRFIRAIVDKRSRAVLLLQIYEEEDWQDKVRFEQQQAELMRYREMRAQYDQAQAQLAAMQTMPPPMDPFMAQQQAGAMNAIAALEPPMPPSWTPTPDDPMAEPDPVKRVPIHMFSHAVCIEPLVGPRGLGYGRIQADYNVAANIALSQYTDSATANNAKVFLTTRDVGFKETPSLTPGTFIPIDGISPQDLQTAIREITPGPANDQLIRLVEMFYAWGQSSMQAPNVFSGEPGKSGETYRGIATRIEQATKQLSVVSRKYADFVEQIYKNNARLNAQFLPDEQIIFLADNKFGGGEELRVGRALYDRSYRIEIRADMRYTSQAQRIQEADELLQLPAQVPPLQTDTAFIHAAVKKALEARDMHELVPLLGPPPPPPMTPFGAMEMAQQQAMMGAPLEGGPGAQSAGPPPDQLALTPEGSPPANLEPTPGPGGPAPKAPLTRIAAE